MKILYSKPTNEKKEKEKIKKPLEPKQSSRVINKSLLRPSPFRPIKQNLHITTVITHTAESAIILVNESPRMIELDNAAVVKDQNLIVIDDSLQTMGDGDDSAAVELAERFLDFGIGGVVD